jgi:CubicO group peptidase (beta-lactamase class C family)
LTDKDLATKARRVVESYANLGRFSGSVLVAKNGRVLFSNSYGLASLEFGAPNTSRTRFDLGSLSKQFTAGAILKLKAQGKLSTTDSISKYLSGYPKPQGDLVTIHHLLSHTSGIPSLGQRGGIPDPPHRGSPVTLDELISIFRDQPLQFKPGEKYRYNNSGYILLAAIIEKVSGMAYDNYLKANLFDPAGMQDTGRIPADKVALRTANGYMGYAPEFIRPPYIHPSWSIGAGGIHSTVEDLFKWDQALYDGKILSATEIEQFFKAHVSRGRPGHDYAYGWFIDDTYGHKAINHGGTTEGFVSAYYRFPRERVFIVVLSNYMPRLGIDISDQIADRISAAVFGAEYKLPPEVVKLSEAELRRVTGEYEFETGYKLNIRLESGRLASKAEGTESWTLPTYSSQVKLDRKNPKVEKAVRIVRSFVEGDHQPIVELAAPGRRADISTEMVSRIKNELVKKWGRLIRITPFAITNDGSVRSRVTFTNGEMFILIEFNKQDEFVGWFYGNRMMPPEVTLIPVSRTTFYADGFPYDEGAAWGEKAVFLEFRAVGGKITGVAIKQDGEYVGRQIARSR